MQEELRKSSDYITQLQMTPNLQVSKGLDRRLGGEHPVQELVEAVIFFALWTFLWDGGVPAVSFFLGVGRTQRMKAIRLWSWH